MFEKFIADKQFHYATALAKRFTKQGHEKYIRKWRVKRERKSEDKICERDETLLHYIVHFSNTESLLQTIIQICPDLIYTPRTHPDYLGQTPLHIAIARGYTEAFRIILKTAWLNSNRHIRMLVNARVTGVKFNNTVMMGELPLFVAALTNDTSMVKTLIAYGAVPYIRNGQGNTIFHVLIQYASLYREKVKQVRMMIACINGQIKKMMEKTRKSRLKKKHMEDKLRNSMGHSQEARKRNHSTYDYMHVWYIRNNRQYTALELAAKHGLIEIFNDILNLEDVYLHYGQQDGIFDDKSYDITEIDTIAKYNSQRGVEIDTNGNPTGNLKPETGISPFRRYPRRESILQMMYSSKQSFSSVAALIDLPPIKQLIKSKWHFYRTPYVIWMVLHYLFIVALSVFAVFNSEIVFSKWALENDNYTATDYESSEDNEDDLADTALPTMRGPAKDSFVDNFRWIAFAVGVFYLAIGLVQVIIKGRKPNAYVYVGNNFSYVLLIFILSLGIITDVIMHYVSFGHNGIPIILAVLAGWWFNAFFLRGWRLFGFFTEMIHRVIFGDFFRFSALIVLQLFSFTTTMTVVYQGKNTPSIDGTETSMETRFPDALMQMFTLMIGLTSLPFLDRTEQTWLTYVLYVTFILTTYILLINALVAMMSATCAHLLINRYSHWRVQQLSVVIFLEDLLSLFTYSKAIAAAGDVTAKDIHMFNPSTGTFQWVRRYYLHMSSLIQDATRTDIDEIVAAIERRTENCAVGASSESVIQNIQKGFFEAEYDGTDLDDESYMEIASMMSEPEEPDPLRYFTVYHEFNTTNPFGPADEDKSDAESTETALQRITKMATGGRIIAYARKAKSKVGSKET